MKVNRCTDAKNVSWIKFDIKCYKTAFKSLSLSSDNWITIATIHFF